MTDPHAGQPVLQAGHPLKGAQGALILLHGRGASAEDILGLSGEFDDPELAYLAPQASGHTWYPYSFLAPLAQNEPWLTSALNQVKRVVDAAVEAGVPRERIVIAGFSQGACLASEFTARNAARYGGLIAFTGGLIGPPGTEFRYTGNLAGMPAFFGSGDPDAHAPWQRVADSAAVLSSIGAEVVLKRYPGMPHTINREEIDEARKLVARSLCGAPLQHDHR
ncbi:MAG TPA: dienelactone hydrolase family protein [Bryobacteraceae bacterium]|nr:dienelactone hydrolase family protein [Bryobacteraceae bacterium]